MPKFVCRRLPSYFFVYCDAKKRAGLFSTALTFRQKRATIQTLPWGGESRSSTGAFPYDHMFDHNVPWRTWKQRRKERQRASFPEQTGANGFLAHVTPSSTAVWDVEVGCSSHLTRTIAVLTADKPRGSFLCGFCLSLSKHMRGTIEKAC